MDYIARDDVVRAESFANELLDACQALAETPHGYPEVRRYSQRVVRKKVHGRYVILYEDRSDELRVVHIVHGARNWQDLLDD